MKISITKSMVPMRPVNKKVVEKVIAGKMLAPGHAVQEEVKRLMFEKGITIDLLLGRYKFILESLPDKVNASDILKAGDTLLRLWGVQTAEDQTVLKVGAILQSKSADDLRTFVMELSTKTQTYLNKVRKQEQPVL